jgi:2-methylisocitrate lyase-like PEP mutase family enzyme
VRAIAQHHDLPFFINARIDAYLSNLPPEARLEETRKRALAYVDAGADGIFVPGLADADEIATLVRVLPVPLNVYAGYPGAPESHALQQLGVRRISLGCGPMQATLAHLGAIVTEALDDGRYDTMGKRMLTPAEANGLFRSVAHKAEQTREVPYVGMGDGPVAQLVARQRRAPLREIELTTRNSNVADRAPAWWRLVASIFGDRATAKAGSP